MQKELNDNEKFLAATNSLQEEGYFDDTRPLEELLPADDWRLILVKKFREQHERNEEMRSLKAAVGINNLFHEVGIEDKIKKAIILRNLGARPNDTMKIVGIKKSRYDVSVKPFVPAFGSGNQGESLWYVYKELKKYLLSKIAK